jgi:hypothetical protein
MPDCAQCAFSEVELVRLDSDSDSDSDSVDDVNDVNDVISEGELATIMICAGSRERERKSKSRGHSVA